LASETGLGLGGLAAFPNQRNPLIFTLHNYLEAASLWTMSNSSSSTVLTFISVDNNRMGRPCFLVVDREFSANISTRKLIIETAKFNVITAYSGAEAVESVKRFPALDGVVLDAGVRDLPAEDVVNQIKDSFPKLPIIVICAPGSIECARADYHLEFFDPGSLLELLQKLRPAETQAIQERNQVLSIEEEKN
jgi:response regulator RpfG family c-di-GMP phosphodiesterase